VVVNDVGTALGGEGSDTAVAEAVVEEIRDAGGEAAASSASVTGLDSARQIIETALDRFGRIDILINNAGILKDRSFLKMSEAEWDGVMAVHLKGGFNVTKAALPHMKAQNYGRIVFTASTSGLFGNFGQTNYGSAKMGMVGLMNSLVIEMGRYDVRINTIAPTAATRMTDHIFSEETKAKMAVDYNVPMVLYLVSEENRETGMIFCMKGGWYSRTAIVCGRGVNFDEDHPATPEAIRDRFPEICNLEEAVPLESGADTMRYVK
jgi:NAD(P)-dependent dehydrogenase (short-subunit alcohol dehydrogenase family)